MHIDHTIQVRAFGRQSNLHYFSALLMGGHTFQFLGYLKIVVHGLVIVFDVDVLCCKAFVVDVEYNTDLRVGRVEI